MFFRYSTQVPVAMAVVESRVKGIRDNLEEWAGIAYREGEELHSNVGRDTIGFAKTVSLEIGTPEIRSSGVVFTIRWSAIGAESLFPHLNADLVLSHVGRKKTRLTLEGTYAPPLGTLGRVIDRVVLRKFAEATIESWVDRIAAAVSTPAVSADGQARLDPGTRSKNALDREVTA